MQLVMSVAFVTIVLLQAGLAPTASCSTHASSQCNAAPYMQITIAIAVR
jgi:hypothetical protein